MTNGREYKLKHFNQSLKSIKLENKDRKKVANDRVNAFLS